MRCNIKQILLWIAGFNGNILLVRLKYENRNNNWIIDSSLVFIHSEDYKNLRRYKTSSCCISFSTVVGTLNTFFKLWFSKYLHESNFLLKILIQILTVNTKYNPSSKLDHDVFFQIAASTPETQAKLLQLKKSRKGLKKKSTECMKSCLISPSLINTLWLLF